MSSKLIGEKTGEIDCTVSNSYTQWTLQLRCASKLILLYQKTTGLLCPPVSPPEYPIVILMKVLSALVYAKPIVLYRIVTANYAIGESLG
jgi:hypothetical protein